MINKLRVAAAWLRSHVDGRDLLAAAGLCLLCYGGELLYRGAGFTASGAVLILVAVLVR